MAVKWEYTFHIQEKLDVLEHYLNKLGKQGWEAVSLTIEASNPVTWQLGPNSPEVKAPIVVLLKRPL